MSHGVPEFLSRRGRKGLPVPVRRSDAVVEVPPEVIEVPPEVVEEEVTPLEFVEEVTPPVEEETEVEVDTEETAPVMGEGTTPVPGDGDEEVVVEPTMAMTRVQLDAMALDLGIAHPDKIGTKQDVIDAINLVLHPVVP